MHQAPPFCWPCIFWESESKLISIDSSSVLGKLLLQMFKYPLRINYLSAIIGTKRKQKWTITQNHLYCFKLTYDNQTFGTAWCRLACCKTQAMATGWSKGLKYFWQGDWNHMESSLSWQMKWYRTLLWHQIQVPECVFTFYHSHMNEHAYIERL